MKPGDIIIGIPVRIVLGFILLLQSLSLMGKNLERFNVEPELKKLVNERQLHFPVSTQRIYRKTAYRSLWFDRDMNHSNLWNASDLITNSGHYGLNALDYHADKLAAGKLASIFQGQDTTINKAVVDILFTDAMLLFIADLHYGKLNPSFTRTVIDTEDFIGMRSDSVLAEALSGSEFLQKIQSVQPAFKGYRDLQEYLKLLVGQYQGDAYEVSPATLKLIRLNLERWRWLNAVQRSQPYVLINIPAFTLSYIGMDRLEEFKVIVGMPAAPTPVLTSEMQFFTSAPEWKVPRKKLKRTLLPGALKDSSWLRANNFVLYDKKGNIVKPTYENLKTVRSKPSKYRIKQYSGTGNLVFHFRNPYSIYLYDSPDKSLFRNSARGLTHGSIGLDNPEQLVKVLLRGDFSEERLPDVQSFMKKHRRRMIRLYKPVPILITYFTCEIKDGMLLSYDDLYKQDSALAKDL